MESRVEIRTKDGRKIWLCCFLPAISTGKVMIVAPAAGLTQEFYKTFAGFFPQWGFTVVTFDYRGIGSSAPEQLKGYEASMQQWAVQDIDAVIRYVRNNYPRQEIIYTGHAIGGEIIGLAQGSQYISRLVLVNSALSCKKLWPLKDRFRISAMKIAVRFLNKWFGYYPGILGNVPMGVMNEWSSWCSNPNGLFDSFPDSNYRKLQIPLLAFSFSDDWHCPSRAVEELLSHFANAVKTWYHINPAEVGKKKIGHTGFFDPSMKTILWMKLVQWIKEEERRERSVVVRSE
jgi:predicted alpha/beta hydrolase